MALTSQCYASTPRHWTVTLLLEPTDTSKQLYTAFRCLAAEAYLLSLAYNEAPVRFLCSLTESEVSKHLRGVKRVAASKNRQFASALNAAGSTMALSVTDCSNCKSLLYGGVFTEACELSSSAPVEQQLALLTRAVREAVERILTDDYASVHRLRY
jgi:hypothetical protein